MRNGASDALSQGGPISFEHALRLYRQQISEELETYYDDEEVDNACARYARDMREAADIAEKIYQRAIFLAVRKMRASKHEGVQSLGEALASGNYARLAI